MKRFFTGFAWIGFCLSIVAHVWTFFGAPLNIFMILHVGIFPPWLVMILKMRKGYSFSGGFFEKQKQWKNYTDGFFKEIPTLWRIVGGALFVYAFVNFFYGITLMQGGSPTIQDGQYVLLQHGQLIKQLSQAEYIQFNAYNIRIFSGHWMIFYFVSAAALTKVTKKNVPVPEVSGSNDSMVVSLWSIV